MDLQTVMARLEAMGTEQARKTYLRHGVGENAFGVSFANMKVLAKEIKKNQDLAEQLWETGNYEACSMATLIADPKKISIETLNSWAWSLKTYALSDLLTTNLASKTQFAQQLMEMWIGEEDAEPVGRAGWQMLSLLATGKKEVPDELFQPYLTIIEERIHQSKNRIKEAMNGTLIAIGGRNEALEARAIPIAQRIGIVEIDHGDTACKTPDAIEYIKKMRERKKAKA
ncbi:DNA alkylation repair protein [Tumebacillus algifaecis]|uniref:DNA alkylation repair protein n=1 Tax=Tumebacillus algifaecis TaxID=1214604 RepID=A0A223D6G1_9BACL|nr:DNA alkylation repair protein [Tumebacillus algifaecis]ASS77155.1 DNA alkylation repair protein [Tumebacillus algifaecis]